MFCFFFDFHKIFLLVCFRLKYFCSSAFCVCLHIIYCRYISSGVQEVRARVAPNPDEWMIPQPKLTATLPESGEMIRCLESRFKAFIWLRWRISDNFNHPYMLLTCPLWTPNCSFNTCNTKSKVFYRTIRIFESYILYFSWFYAFASNISGIPFPLNTYVARVQNEEVYCFCH